MILDTVEPVQFEDLSKDIRVPLPDFERWMEALDWTYHQISRAEFPDVMFADYFTKKVQLQRPFLSLAEFQMACFCNDPVLWVPAFLREPEDSDHLNPYSLWDYQKESIRYMSHTIHKCGAEVGKTREIVAYSLWKAYTVPNGSALIGAPQQTHLDEIIEAMLEEIEYNSDLSPDLPKENHKKHPHHRFKFLNNFKLNFRPSGHDGEAYRGLHVRTFAIKDEAAKDDHTKQWSEFFRAVKPGCVVKLYSVPDGRRDTEFYRLSKLSESAKSEKEDQEIEAFKSAASHIKALKFRGYKWSKRLMPQPYWTEERKRFYIDLYNGEDSPDYKHNVEGEDGDPANSVFPWQQFKWCIKDIPEYRGMKILVDAGNNEVIVHGYRCEYISGAEGPVPRMVELVDQVYRMTGFFDYAANSIVGAEESEFRKLLKSFFSGAVSMKSGGGDFGFSGDPTELYIKQIIGKKERLIARLQLRGVTYDQQCQAIDALDDIFGPKESIFYGTDFGNAGSAVAHDLQGLPQYQHKDYDDRLRGFMFESTTDNIDEDGEPIIEAKTEKPAKITMKELATEILVKKMQRQDLEYPPDPDIVTAYTGHTCTYGSKHRIYSKSNDHLIDADRVQILARLFMNDLEDDFDCGSNMR
jgi:hypothetical protein